MPSISCVSISGAAYAGVAKRQMSARRVIVVAESHGRGAHVDEAGVKGTISNLLLGRSAGGAEHDIGRRQVAMDDRIHEALGHQERTKHGVSDGGDHLVVSPPEASCGSRGSACLSEVPSTHSMRMRGSSSHDP